MNNVNKVFLKDIEKLSSKILFKELKKIKSKKDIDNFLNKFFTSGEKIVIQKRLSIIHLLNNGMSYRQIGRKLDVTNRTISYVKKGFKREVKDRYPSKSGSGSKDWNEKVKTVLPPMGRGRWNF